MLITEFTKNINENEPEDNKGDLRLLKGIFQVEPQLIKEKKGNRYIDRYIFGMVKGRITDSDEGNFLSIDVLDNNFENYKRNGNNVRIVRKTNKGSQGTFFEKNDFVSAQVGYNPDERLIYLFDTKKINLLDYITLDIIRNKMEKQGYQVNLKVLVQFLCAMDTNQIIILHGAPGMGKTSFVTNIAKALCAECKMIPVRPNWIDNQDLTGYFNPVEHRYCSTPFLDALCEAKDNPNKRYFICLDEMNLAHVEYYLSDILSAMESGNPIPLYSEKDRKDAISRQEWILKNKKDTLEAFDAKLIKANLERYEAKFELPKNVTFVGTLNMDATTNDLSPKVIDRSCIIKVIKADPDDKQQKLRLVQNGALSEEEMEGSDSFEKRLLKILGKVTSIRIEKQKKAMQAWKSTNLLNKQLSDADFQDMYIAMKILPSLNLEDVEHVVADNEKIEFEDMIKQKNWKELYPISFQFLKNMWNQEEQVLNYWRMN